MQHLEVFSPAKINLFLAVAPPRPDGYHELVSLAAPLAFGDRVTVGWEPGGGGERIELLCDSPHAPNGAENLAVRAAAAFQRRFDRRGRVRIDLEKRIPMGAGLGGGSSNASAVLSGLAALAGVDDREGLRAAAAELGADCPLFLDRRPQIMRGLGERLEPLGAPLGERIGRRSALLVFKPSFGIRTGWAYGALDRAAGPRMKLEEAEARVAGFLAGRLELEAFCYNAFEAALFSKYPVLALLKEALGEACDAVALLSGSGSASFAFCPPERLEAAEALVKRWMGPVAFVRRTALLE